MTPGAVYEISVNASGDSIAAAVLLPADALAGLDRDGAARLEARLHDALETALAPYFATVVEAA